MRSSSALSKAAVEVYSTSLTAGPPGTRSAEEHLEEHG